MVDDSLYWHAFLSSVKLCRSCIPLPRVGL